MARTMEALEYRRCGGDLENDGGRKYDGGSQLFQGLERPFVVGDTSRNETASDRIDASIMSSSKGGPCLTGLCTADRTLAQEILLSVHVV